MAFSMFCDHAAVARTNNPTTQIMLFAWNVLLVEKVRFCGSGV